MRYQRKADDDPEAVVCFSQVSDIDKINGTSSASSSPLNRFVDVVRHSSDSWMPRGNCLYNFVYQLLYPKFRYMRDFYPVMFFLDLTCFLIVAAGYNSFGEGGSGDVINDIKVGIV